MHVCLLACACAEALGIFARQEFIAAHPQLCALLEDLAEHHISASGASAAVASAAGEARAALMRARVDFFTRRLLLDELRELSRAGETTGLAEAALPSAGYSAPRVPGAALSFLGRAMDVTAGAAVLGLAAQDDTVRLLDLTPDFVERTELQGAAADAPAPARLARVREALEPHVAGRLANRLCAAAALYAGVDSAGATRASALARGMQLPALVREHQACCAELRRRVLRTRAALAATEWEAYGRSLAVLQLLARLVREFMLVAQPEMDDVYGNFLVVRARALKLKLGLVRLSVMRDTHTAARTQALTVIRQHLAAAIAATRAELSEAVARLDAFAALGPAMDDLAATHAALWEDIENKRWALTELQGDPRFAF